MNDYFALGAVVSLKDMMSSKIDEISKRWDNFKSKLGESHSAVTMMESAFSNFKIGAVMLAGGLAVGAFASSLIDARSESSRLEANIQSLGVAASEVAEISRFGTVMASEMGIAKEAYLTGVYDIKSAISSLTAETLPGFAQTVAQTATATKGDFAELSKLFGMTYNQYRSMYADMSDNDFGKLIGTMMSTAVQKFRTDGSAMNQAMTSLGSTAASLGIHLSEQTAILGTLQNVMNPGEAGTAYRAFLSKIGTGLDKLGISATDATGNLKSMPVVLEELKGKFGDSIDATTELPQLVSAFGEEGVKTILNLLPHVDTLRNDISELGAVEQNLDFSNLERMANANLQSMPVQIARVTEGWKALKGEMGAGMEGPVSGLAGSLADVLGWVAGIAREYPGVARFAGMFVGLTATVLTLGGAFFTAKAALMAYTALQAASAAATGTQTSMLSALGIAQTFAAAKTGILTVATWALNAAMWANPVTWIVAGIIALIGVIALAVVYWDDIKEAGVGAWTWIRDKWSNAAPWARGLMAVLFVVLTGGMGLIVIAIVKYWDDIRDGGVAALDWISSKASGAWNFVRDTWSQAKPYMANVAMGLLAVFLPFIGIPVLIWAKFDWLKAQFFGFLTWIDSALGGIPGRAFQAGVGLVTAIADGVKSMAMAPVNAVTDVLTSIGNFLPHSDADEGPLSTLTSSGRALVTTFAGGAEEELPRAGQMARRFASEMNPDATAEGEQLSGGKGQGLTVNIAKIADQILLGEGGRDGMSRSLGQLLVDAILGELEKVES